MARVLLGRHHPTAPPVCTSATTMTNRESVMAASKGEPVEWVPLARTEVIASQNETLYSVSQPALCVCVSSPVAYPNDAQRRERMLHRYGLWPASSLSVFGLRQG